MKIPISIIKKAFDNHFEKYHTSKNWDINHHIEVWESASRAIRNNSIDEFTYVYNDLKNYWQVFRSPIAQTAPTPGSILKMYKKIDASLLKLRLLDLDLSQLKDIHCALDVMSSIKRNKSGPSLMATTKFLHFYNPRLFVIVDDGIMWNYIFNHSWIWNRIQEVAKSIGKDLPSELANHDPFVWYLPFLYWSSIILKANPSIPSIFYQYLCDHAKVIHPKKYMMAYDSVAIEWLLLGLVEIRPW